jgi:hypothetical protein
MLEAIFGLIGVIIGSLLTYFFSKSIIKQQFETQLANEYFSKKYLPLLSAMREYELGLLLLNESKKPEAIPPTYQNAERICYQKLKLLKEALNRIIKSGMHLFFNNIDDGLGQTILNLYDKIDIITFFTDEKGTEVSEKNLYIENYDDFKKRILKISIKELVKEYQNLLKE